MRDYSFAVERCTDTNLLVGYVPGFPGAHSQAETIEALRVNMREVIAMLLEDGESVLESESQVKGFIVRTLPSVSVWCPAFIFSITGATIAWVHRFADHIYGDGEPLLTFWGFVILGSICKFGFLCCIPFLLRHIFLAMQRDARRALLCAASWAVASAVLIAVLTLFHDRLTEILNNSAVRFYPVSDPSPAIDGYYIGREAWLSRWQSGQVLAIEAGYALALIVLLVGIGYGWKNRGIDQVGIPKMVTACFALLLVGVAWPPMFHLVNWDYDVFIGAMLSGSLALDLMLPPMVYDPTSQIAFPIFTAFTLSTYAALRVGLPKINHIEHKPHPL